MRIAIVKVPALVALGMLCSTCGDDKPSSSSPPITEPPPAAATAAPTSTSTPLPGTQCSLPPVTRPRDFCQREATGDFIPQVDAAIRNVPAGIVDGNQIKDLGAYRLAVYRNLERAGLCVQWGEDREGHREIMVKNSNDYSEQYHIEASNGTVRTGDGAYRSTCYPASFPLNPRPLEPRGDCQHLPPSRSYGCDRAGSPQFVGLFTEVAAEVQRERPHLVSQGYLVASWDEYHDAIVEKLRARGYCALFNVTEISVKNTSEFSEQYQMEYSWGQLRQGTEMWRATCRPATF